MALKSALFLIVISVLGSSCASEISLPEYAEEVEALVISMNARLDQLDAEFVDNALADDDLHVLRACWRPSQQSTSHE